VELKTSSPLPKYSGGSRILQIRDVLITKGGMEGRKGSLVLSNSKILQGKFPGYNPGDNPLWLEALPLGPSGGLR
jgi:hypothetical protein